ncbi:MAG: 30S ribosomal protein S20 [Desulfomonilia bacterium]|jgi:small subunit ribosomal protein S20|uniref:30S ribosomal protein S20 n=1 Tax=anaerobic digester metagenome TaxID=1263854 RepID=A0A485M5Y0_9ZZZZ|nr:30S ribosomal protein S20 [Pseudomonadota bacterium]HON37368.1 30S ribosomal protein S20 [Deltaproteobacteria bacterium]HRS55533.1 30S ribosomal protein S20 [Desulfomonilia bacterium]HPD20545.1 30S ribosomal protein S20 [Deltaproteobacteria bacterium]HPX17275.1 30S ribosomal protein S20 [Deltaproteobacteria bacterium]
MANHASALKRVRQSRKRRLRNKSYKSAISTSVKKTFGSLEEKNAEGAQKYFKEALARLDSAVNKGILHRNAASRKISRLTRKFNSLAS